MSLICFYMQNPTCTRISCSSSFFPYNRRGTVSSRLCVRFASTSRAWKMHFSMDIRELWIKACGTRMLLCHWAFCLLSCFFKHKLLYLANPKLRSLDFLSPPYSTTLINRYICQQLSDWANQLLLAHGVTNQQRAFSTVYIHYI